MTKNLRVLILTVLLFPATSPFVAQLSGSYSIPANFSSLAAAIASLNTGGVTGPVTINIPAGYTETAPLGGYTLTATGTAANPIVFQKSGIGANPVLTAYTGGTATAINAKQDGIWSLLGCDYITIDGISITDQNPVTPPPLMEYGIGFFRASATNGCQNNLVQNCVITLNRNNFALGGATNVNGSRGINMMNALYNTQTTLLAATSAAGSNSNNKFYANTIQNCNLGIVLNGSQASSPYTNADTNNDIGGASVATGNTIINYGGNGATNAAAIQTLSQYNVKISYNLVNNNNGTGIGTDAAYSLRGIFTDMAQAANVTVTNNTLTLHCLDSRMVIYNEAGNSGATNTINISNNLITGCTNINYTSFIYNYDILNLGSPAVLSVTGNTITNGTSNSNSGFSRMICNFSTAIPHRVDISNNSLDYSYNNSIYDFNENIYAIFNRAGVSTCTITINSNKFSNFLFISAPGSGIMNFITNYGNMAACTINGNTWDNLLINHHGTQVLVQNNASMEGLLSITNNSIVGAYTRTGPGLNGDLYCISSAASNGPNSTEDISGNNFSNITSATTGTFGSFCGLCLYDDGPVLPRKTIFNNVISGINYNGSNESYGILVYNLGDGSTASGSAIYNNNVSGISSAGNVYGIAIGGSVSANYEAAVYSNTINTLSSSIATVVVEGLTLYEELNGVNMYKNKIYDIAHHGSLGKANGLHIRGNNITACNNIIGDIKAPISNDTNAVAGIYVDSYAAKVNLYNNTVYLNGGSSGTHFGSAALYAYTTLTLTLRNNIFINLAMPKGAGLSAAYKRRSVNLNTYEAGSNNNLFYAGIPGPKHVLFSNSTNSYPTLAAMQNIIAPREAASITENTPFLSTLGTNANYLHVDPSLPSNTNNGAAAIALVVDDIDTQVRQGAPGYAGTGTAPDIGADEYDQVTGPCAAVAAGVISPFTYTACTGNSLSIAAGGFTSTANVSFQWLMSQNAGGPYTNITTGGSQLSFTNPNSPVGTSYYLLQANCTAGNYTTVSNEVTVTAYPLPTGSITVSAATLCEGETLQLNAVSAAGNHFYWTGPGGLTSQSQQITIGIAVPAVSGTYTLLISDSHCTTAPLMQQVLVDACTGLNTQAAAINNVSVYPNPFNSILTAKFEYEGDKTLRIVNAQGMVVCEKTTTGTSEIFDLTAYAKGIYFIELRSKDASVNYKIVKE